MTERIWTKAKRFKRNERKGSIKVRKGRSDVREYFER
jgi:hypothetical protein